MTIRRRTPQEIASFMRGPDGRPTNPDAVRDQYLRNAAQMREVAERARASRSGKSRGFTAEKAEQLARNAEEYAVLVPAEMRRLAG